MILVIKGHGSSVVIPASPWVTPDTWGHSLEGFEWPIICGVLGGRIQDPSGLGAVAQLKAIYLSFGGAGVSLRLPEFGLDEKGACMAAVNSEAMGIPA